jgi:hypothetical protein
MRPIVIACCFLPFFGQSQQNQFRSPLRDVPADSVVAYAYGLLESGEWSPMEHSESIVRGTGLIASVNYGKPCDATNLSNLFAVIEDSASFGASPAACFIPHHAIVWWKDNKPVQVIDVCFGCNSMHSSLTTPAQAVHKTEEEWIDEDGNIEKYILWNHGFSLSGRKALILWFDGVGVGLGLPDPEQGVWEDEDD